MDTHFKLVDTYNLRERTLMILVAAAAATAGTLGIVLNQHARVAKTAPATALEQVSDAASAGGYQTADTYSSSAPGGYAGSETASVIAGTLGVGSATSAVSMPELVSDAASGAGYQAP